MNVIATHHENASNNDCIVYKRYELIKFNPSLDNRCAIDFSYLFMRMAKLVLNLPMRCTKGPLSIISL